MSDINNSNDLSQNGDCCVQNTAGYSIDVSQDVAFGDAVVQPYDSSCMEPVTQGGGKRRKRSKRSKKRKLKGGDPKDEQINRILENLKKALKGKQPLDKYKRDIESLRIYHHHFKNKVENVINNMNLSTEI